jgi:hypothetical protein
VTLIEGAVIAAVALSVYAALVAHSAVQTARFAWTRQARLHRALAELAGSLDGERIIDIAATATGGGYWLLGADGDVYAFGDAAVLGSPLEDSLDLNAPVAAIAADPLGGGYWIAAEDGGVFTYGFGLPFHGSVPGGNTAPAALAPRGDCAPG